MSVDITKFVVAVQIFLERFGGCNVIDFKYFWNVTKIIIANIITIIIIIIIIIIINILAHTLFQVQCVLFNNQLKYTYFSL